MRSHSEPAYSKPSYSKPADSEPVFSRAAQSEGFLQKTDLQLDSKQALAQNFRTQNTLADDVGGYAAAQAADSRADVIVTRFMMVSSQDISSARSTLISNDYPEFA